MLHYLSSAKVSVAKTELANLEAGLDLFKYDVDRYPTTDEGLQALLKAPPGIENWNGPYIKKAAGIKDPWGQPYHYRSPGEHGAYDLYSDGPDPATHMPPRSPPLPIGECNVCARQRGR